MATFKFSHVEFRDAITREELSVIYPTTFVEPWFYYYATAKTGEKVGIRNIIEDVNTGRRYVSSTRTTYGFVRDYNNELWNPGATIWKGGEIQSRLGITKDTTVRFIDELYDPNTGAILARGVGTIPFKVMTPVTPDVIIDKVLIMDAETLRPVSEVRIDRNYYFQVHFRVKGSPPLTFKVRWDAVEGNKSFLLGEKNWELRSYEPEYDEEWTATGYAVTGKWLIDMVNKNFTDHSKINVCCKIEWDWNGQHYVRIKCNSYPIAGGCTTACESSCQTGCEVSCETTCEKSCQESCQKVCQTHCETACETTCEKSCQYYFRVIFNLKDFEVSFPIAGGCTTACESSCQTGCEVSCQTQCEKACQEACETSCQEKCEKGCQTGCEIACQTGCEVSCETTCEKSCQEGCEVSCQQECEHECEVGCEAVCQTACESRCQETCEVYCEVGCEVSCEEKCEKSCMTSEQGVGWFDKMAMALADLLVIPVEQAKAILGGIIALFVILFLFAVFG